MRVWDTESQKCLALASHKQYVTGGSPHRSVCQVACHPSKDEVFLSACDKTGVRAPCARMRRGPLEPRRDVRWQCR